MGKCQDWLSFSYMWLPEPTRRYFPLGITTSCLSHRLTLLFSLHYWAVMVIVSYGDHEEKEHMNKRHLRWKQSRCIMEVAWPANEKERRKNTVKVSWMQQSLWSAWQWGFALWHWTGWLWCIAWGWDWDWSRAGHKYRWATKCPNSDTGPQGRCNSLYV